MPLLSLLVSLFVGARRARRCGSQRCSRRGWHEWGVVDADSLDDAESRYAMADGRSATSARPMLAPIRPSANRLRGPPHAGTALGLLLIPEQR